jgi:protocatechuate 3,4-dioxygenase beta subunit
VANSTWTVDDITNVRTAAIAAASYSRARYATIAANFDANDTSLSGPANTATKEVLIRASGDLADLITSAKKGIGNPPVVGSITAYMKWRGVKANELTEAAHGIVYDVNGKPIEGVQVDVIWPKPDGSKVNLRFWTDETGHGHITNRVWDTALMAKQTVTEKVTTDQTTVTKTTWWYETKRLADSTPGFLSTMNDRTVQAGQTVTVTSRAKDTAGNPIAGLYVEWTWEIGSTTKVTSGYTDSNGNAKSTFTVASTTTKSTIYVTGRTSAYSINRSSKTSFYRTD